MFSLMLCKLVLDMCMHELWTCTHLDWFLCMCIVHTCLLGDFCTGKDFILHNAHYIPYGYHIKHEIWSLMRVLVVGNFEIIVCLAVILKWPLCTFSTATGFAFRITTLSFVRQYNCQIFYISLYHHSRNGPNIWFMWYTQGVQWSQKPGCNSYQH